MSELPAEADLENEFNRFWSEQRRSAVKGFCEAESLIEGAVMKMIDDYSFSGTPPLRETVFSALSGRPKLMERKKIYGRVVEKLSNLIHTFDENMG